MKKNMGGAKPKKSIWVNKNVSSNIRHNTYKYCGENCHNKFSQKYNNNSF